MKKHKYYFLTIFTRHTGALRNKINRACEILQRKCENLVNNKKQNKIVSTAEEEEHNENEEEEKESCSLSLSEKDELIKWS